MDVALVDQFQAYLSEKIPGVKVAFKDETASQRFLGMLLRPFNPMYATDYVTTMGTTIYFPTRDYYKKDPLESFVVIAHEFVHISDSKQDPLFRLKYLFPQVLVILPVLLYGILAWSHAWVLLLALLGYIVGSMFAGKSKAVFYLATILGVVLTGVLGWWYTKWKLCALLGLAALAPWVAYWRTAYELRGYGMTMAVLQWMFGSVSSDTRKLIVEQFVGPSYYFMSRDQAAIERTLDATKQQAEQGALQRISPYSIVHDFLYAHRLLHGAP